MKKYFVVILVLIVVILGLGTTLAVMQLKDDSALPPTWDEKVTDYVTAYASIGVIEDGISATSRAVPDTEKYETYVFQNKEIKSLLVNKGDVIEEGVVFFENEPMVNKYLGRVERIEESNNSLKLVVSNFDYLICRLYVPQSMVDNIALAQEANVNYNGKNFLGNVRKIGYMLDDMGYLEVEVSIDDSRGIFANAQLDVRIITYRKTGVLRIPKEALINISDKYYVDVLQNENLIRKEIEIGIIGDSYIEVKQGLLGGEIVIVNVYE